ncbi:hypothetical protein ACET3Z_009529 [Daucus carota]
MSSRRGKKKARTSRQYELGDEDMISRLPDELIHHVLSFVDTKQAIQTCVLSKRWELVWTSLPFLNFGLYDNLTPKVVSKFMRHVLSNRNHESQVSHLSLSVRNKGLSRHLLEKYVDYAISHNLHCLNLDLPHDSKPVNLSVFSSKSLNKLTLNANLEKCERISDCWDLPCLTTLRLKGKNGYGEFSDNWFTMKCLPALRKLRFDDYDLSKSSFSFSLPALTTLCLNRCTLPTTVWDIPTLKSIELHGGQLPQNLNEIFSALVNLQNLKVVLTSRHNQEYVISCPPQLLNLSIIAADYYPCTCNTIVVSAPKLCNFTSFGVITAMVGVPELETVNVRLQGVFNKIGWTSKKRARLRLINMLPGLANAKNLTFDLDSIKALNEISNVLVGFPSPFHKLKYVKLPWRFKESKLQARAVDAKTELLDLLTLVNDARIRLQDKEALRVEKLSEIEKVFGTMGINLVVGFIGDDLL